MSPVRSSATRCCPFPTMRWQRRRSPPPARAHHDENGSVALAVWPFPSLCPFDLRDIEVAMFYWLSRFSEHVEILNVFRYITFRTGGAIATAALFVFFFGPWTIDMLRIKQGKGQPIR